MIENWLYYIQSFTTNDKWQMTNDITHEDSFSILIFFSLFFVMRLLDDDEILDVQGWILAHRYTRIRRALWIEMTDDVCIASPTSYAFFTLSSRSVNVIIDAKMIEVSCGKFLLFVIYFWLCTLYTLFGFPQLNSYTPPLPLTLTRKVYYSMRHLTKTVI